MKLCFATIAAIASMASLATSYSDNPYGVVAHVAYNEPAARTCATAKDAGLGWVRCDFDWDQIEREEGVWDFSKLDGVVAAAESEGIQLLPILGYSVPWAKPTYRHLDRWTNYVCRVVGRYRRRLPVVEVWNEQNLGSFWFGDPNPTNYLALLKATYEAVKAIDPEIKVSFGGTSRVPLDYIGEIYGLDGAGCFDILSIHPYTFPRRPEGMMDVQIEELRALMEENGDADKPVWITEIGWSTHRPTFECGDLLLAGLRAAAPDRKTWRMVYVPARTDHFGECEGVCAALGNILPVGSTIRAVVPAKLADLLAEGNTDAVVYPFNEEYPADTATTVADFVKAGGTLVEFGGGPMFHAFRPDARNARQHDKKANTRKDRENLRIDVTSPWMGKRSEGKTRVFPTECAKGVAVPEDGFEAEHFLSDRLLKPEDAFIPLLAAETNGMKAVAAAVCRFGGDMKGAVVLSCIPMGTTSCLGNIGTCDEDRQARLLVRALGIAFAENVEKCFTYELRQTEKDPCDPESHFGIVRDDFTHKRAYVAYKTFIEQRPTGSVQSARIWRTADGNECFPQWTRPDGSRAGMIWTTGRERRARLEFSGDDVEFFDIDGKRLQPSREGRSVLLDIGESPVYFRGAELVSGWRG
ncbi:MAG: hypothetical protein ACOX9C_01970 [Kiritimatiellia bacterium]